MELQFRFCCHNYLKRLNSCFRIPTGRLAGNVIMTGDILLNGKKRRMDYGVAVMKTSISCCEILFSILQAKGMAICSVCESIIQLGGILFL